MLVEMGDEAEQGLPSGACEGQVAQFVDDDEVAPAHGLGEASLASLAMFLLQEVDQFDGIEEAAADAAADAGAGDRHAQVRLSGAGSPDQDYVAGRLQEGALGEPPHDGFIDVAVGEREPFEFLGGGQPGDAQLVLDRVGALVGDFRLQEFAQVSVLT